MNSDERLSRSRLLLGDKVMERLSQTRVIIFGVGGVGSWAAEALVRTGLTYLTIVDGDSVAPSNINRQRPATVNTVGELKVDALKRQLLLVNPDAQITAIPRLYTELTAGEFNLPDYDYVIDAIDSLDCKAHLILNVTRLKGVKLFSSMGAALKVDPTRVQVAEFWKVQGCPLARSLRQRFKRSGHMPGRKFKCVYSDEPHYMCEGGGLGSLLQVTGTAGFTLASLVITDIIEREKEKERQ